jgi:hypothetical protein
MWLERRARESHLPVGGAAQLLSLFDIDRFFYTVSTVAR